MRELIIQTAKNHFNPNIVDIDTDVIEKTKFELNEVCFFFHKKNNIPLNNIKENIFFSIAFNSINFQYWALVGKKKIERYELEGQVGGLAILHGFYQFVKLLKKPSTKIELIQEKDITTCFGEIPDKKGRLEILKESMSEHKFEKVYEVLINDAQKGLIDVFTAQKIADIMPKSFQDPFLRKIQLALYDIGEILKVEYPRLILDLTVAAEYQLAKVLKAMHILKYNPGLDQNIQLMSVISQDSNEENAIRAATILACEYICEYHNIQAPYLDNFLWNKRKDFGNIRFHLTNTRRY